MPLVTVVPPLTTMLLPSKISRPWPENMSWPVPLSLILPPNVFDVPEAGLIVSVLPPSVTETFVFVLVVVLDGLLAKAVMVLLAPSARVAVWVVIAPPWLPPTRPRITPLLFFSVSVAARVSVPASTAVKPV